MQVENGKIMGQENLKLMGNPSLWRVAGKQLLRSGKLL
jgi:hypothetical protein